MRKEVLCKFLTSKAKAIRAGMKSCSKSALAVTLSFLTAFSAVTINGFSAHADAADPVTNNVESQTKYNSVSDFSDARWLNIQKAVFKDIDPDDKATVPLDPSELMDKEVIPGNPYFNWTDTSSLGITSDEIYDDTHPEGVEGPHEIVTYTFHDADNNRDATVLCVKYDVSNANQLRYALRMPKTSDGVYYDSIINITADIDLGGNRGKIWDPVQPNDFDWHNKQLPFCYIEGNGHTIYNMKIASDGDPTNTGEYGSGLFAMAPPYLIVKNLGFKSSMILNSINASNTDINPGVKNGYLYSEQCGLVAANLEGRSYLYNVNSDVSFFNLRNDNVSGAGGLIGRKQVNYYLDNSHKWMPSGDLFIKNCSVEKCYMYGGDHLGGFTSYIASEVEDPESDTGEGKTQYDTPFPTSPEYHIAQYFYDNDQPDGRSEYPTMIENCRSTDGIIFSYGHDSGAFISCGDNMIVRNSFSNNDIYAKDNTGGFIGRVQAHKPDGGATMNYSTKTGGVLTDYNDKQNIAGYFENCYSSGIVEGEVAMGGFIGLDNSSRDEGHTEEERDCGSSCKNTSDQHGMSAVVYKNCYSTSMVGMDYAGKYCGGFIGLCDNYSMGYDVNDIGSDTPVGACVKVNGKDEYGYGSFFINCYAAGEVGNVLTITDKTEALKQEDKFFNDNNVNHAALNDSGRLNYYPTGGFAGAVGLDVADNTARGKRTAEKNFSPYSKSYGNFYNCYYDMQTTAMREMAVGLASADVNEYKNGTENTQKASVAFGANPEKAFNLKGVTGLYTQSTTDEDNKKLGLTDFTNENDDKWTTDVWNYEEEYYPQLQCYMASDLKHSYLNETTQVDITKEVQDSPFFIKDSEHKELSELTPESDGSYTYPSNYSKPVMSLANTTDSDGNVTFNKDNVYAAQMAPVLWAYRSSQASTSTVMLDNWEYIMDVKTGQTADDSSSWTADFANRMTKYYVLYNDETDASADLETKYNGIIVAQAKYFNSKGEVISEDNRNHHFSEAAKVGLFASDKLQSTDINDAFAVYDANEKIWTSGGRKYESEFDIPKLKGAIAEWRKVFTNVDPGNYEFKIKEGVNSSESNTYGKGQYNDTVRINLEVASSNEKYMIKFHYGELRSNDFYVKCVTYPDANASEPTGEQKTLAEGRQITYTPRDDSNALYVRGDMNGWNADKEYQLQYSSDKDYTLTVELEPNQTDDGDIIPYTFKVADDSWGVDNYGVGGEVNGSNMSFTLTDKAKVTFTFTDDDKHLTKVTADPPEALTDVVTEEKKIDFKGISVIAPQAITGFNWLEDGKELEAAQAGEMTDPDGDNWFEKTFAVNKDNFNKSYGYKVIIDAVDAGLNKYFYLPSPADNVDSQEVTFHYNSKTQETYVTTNYFKEKDQITQHAVSDNYYVAGSSNLTGFDYLYYPGENEYLKPKDLEKLEMVRDESMTETETNKYFIKTFENLKPGSYSFKIASGGTWDSISFGDNRDPNKNYEFTLSKEAKVSIKFDEAEGIITVVTDPEDAISRKEYVVTGTENLMNLEWNKDEPVMKYDQVKSRYYHVIENVQPGNNYAFKVIEKGIDSGNNIVFRVNGDSAVNIRVEYDDVTGETTYYALDGDGNDISKNETDDSYEHLDGKTRNATVIDDVKIDFWSVLGDTDFTGYNWGSDEGTEELAAQEGKMTSFKDATTQIDKDTILADDERNQASDEIFFWKTKDPFNASLDEMAINTEKVFAFKVAANGDWDTGISYGDGGLNGQNMTLNIKKTANIASGNVMVYLNLTDGFMSCIPNLKGAEVVEQDAARFEWVIYGDSDLTFASAKVPGIGVYDTVRDITGEFTFTSGEAKNQRGVTWYVNDEMNEEYEFDKNVDFSLNHTVDGKLTETTYTPEIISLLVKAQPAKDTAGSADPLKEDDYVAKYSVNDFAPGKQWLTINAFGYGYFDKLRAWKVQQIRYTAYKDAYESYVQLRREYVNALSGFVIPDDIPDYQGQKIDDENIYAYVKYLSNQPEDSYEYETYKSMKEHFGEGPDDDLLTRYDAAKAALAALTAELQKDPSITGIPTDDKLYKPGASEYPFPADSPETTGESIVGARQIRLIPSAYIEAGVDATVNVIESNDTSVNEEQQRAENAVRIRSESDDIVAVESSEFADVSDVYFPYYNFAQTAGYLVTDRIGLGIYKNYKNLDKDGVYESPSPKYQTYDAAEIRDDLDFTQRVAGKYFAMSSVYNQAESYTDADDPGLKPDALVNQSLIGDTYTADTSAETGVAKTIVKIFKEEKDASGQNVYRKIGMNADPTATDEYALNYKKWSGQSKFTSNDAGVYSVRFLWMLKDGRYLTDEKEVVIRSLTSGLQKSVDLQYVSTSDKEITYTLSYVNDRTTNSVNITLFDVLPFVGDTRLKRNDDGLAPDLNTGNQRTGGEINDNFKLKSITFLELGGAQIYGLYYTTDDKARSYLTQDDGTTANPAAADKLQRKDGRITDTGISWTDVPKGRLATYNNKQTYDINAENVKAIALTGKGLPVGETITIQFTVECDLKEDDISDEFVNNSFYSVDGVVVDKSGEEIEDPLVHKADYSNSVLTAVVGRDISGYAWHDISADGVLDKFEHRLGNVEVAIYEDPDNDGEYTDSGIPHQITDNMGFYIFKNIPYIENCRIVFLTPDGGKISVNDWEGKPTGDEVEFDKLRISKTQTQSRYDSEIGSYGLAKQEGDSIFIGSDVVKIPNNFKVFTDTADEST